jgi:hypothetical protein
MPSDECGGESAATTPAEEAADIVYRVTDPTFLLRDRGYTEWYTQRLSKYRERVVYRRWNRWQIVYYLAPFYGGFPFVADSLPYVEPLTYWLNETLGSAPLGLHWFHAIAGAWADDARQEREAATIPWSAALNTQEVRPR